jgi:hypothetical protein
MMTTEEGRFVGGSCWETWLIEAGEAEEHEVAKLDDYISCESRGLALTRHSQGGEA